MQTLHSTTEIGTLLEQSYFPYFEYYQNQCSQKQEWIQLKLWETEDSVHRILNCAEKHFQSVLTDFFTSRVEFFNLSKVWNGLMRGYLKMWMLNHHTKT